LACGEEFSANVPTEVGATPVALQSRREKAVKPPHHPDTMTFSTSSWKNGWSMCLAKG